MARSASARDRSPRAAPRSGTTSTPTPTVSSTSAVAGVTRRSYSSASAFAAATAAAAALPAAPSPVAGALLALAAEEDGDAVGVRGGAAGRARAERRVVISHASTLAPRDTAREFLAAVLGRRARLGRRRWPCQRSSADRCLGGHALMNVCRAAERRGQRCSTLRAQTGHARQSWSCRQLGTRMGGGVVPLRAEERPLRGRRHAGSITLTVQHHVRAGWRVPSWRSRAVSDAVADQRQQVRTFLSAQKLHGQVCLANVRQRRILGQ